MQLDEFITETIKQLIDGVSSAEEYAKQHQASVNPSRIFKTTDGTILAHGVAGGFVAQVEFDIALTAVEGKEKQGKLGVAAAVFGIGGEIKAETSSTSVSRIKFMLPVSLPYGQTPMGARQIPATPNKPAAQPG